MNKTVIVVCGLLSCSLAHTMSFFGSGGGDAARQQNAARNAGDNTAVRINIGNLSELKPVPEHVQLTAAIGNLADFKPVPERMQMDLGLKEFKLLAGPVQVKINGLSDFKPLSEPIQVKAKTEHSLTVSGRCCLHSASLASFLASCFLFTQTPTSCTCCPPLACAVALAAATHDSTKPLMTAAQEAAKPHLARLIKTIKPAHQD